MNTAVNEHQSIIQKYMKNNSTYIQCKKLIFYMKNNPNLCYILSFKMIGQFVEFKEYHINIQATYSLTEKIMHLNWLYSVFVEFKEYNKIYMLTYRLTGK